MATAAPLSAFSQHHPYQPVDPDEVQTDIPPPRTVKALVPNSDASILPWRPFFLRRLVLLVFVIVFVLVIVAIESILVVSNQNDGIATSSYAMHYLWTYGPTAFLTIVAALWARAEYQSKLIAPWIRLSQPGNPISRTLLLDYVRQFPLFVIFRSLRQKDFLVSIVATVSILVKILIVISTGLLSLSTVAVTKDSVPMVLQNTFRDDNSGLSSGSNLPWYVMLGQSALNLTLPDGISTEFAYQSLEANLADAAESRVTADGLTNWIDCEPIELGLAGAYYPAPQSGLETLNVTLASPSCNVSVATLPGVFTSGSSLSALFARFEQVQCDGITGDAGKRVLLMFGNLTYHRVETNSTNPYTPTLFGNLTDSTQMFCVPTYNITTVEVVRNSTGVVSVQPVQGALNRTLDSVTAWDIMAAQFAATEVGVMGTAYGWDVKLDSVTVDVDLPMQTALNSSGAGLEAISLMQPEVLKQIAATYYQQIGAIIAKESLMEPAAVRTTGSAAVDANRLIVSAWAAQWMVALLAVCVLLTAVALFLVPTQGFLPCNPSSLFRSIPIFLHAPQLLEQLRLSGAADDEHLARFLERSTFQSGLVCASTSNQNEFRIFDRAHSQDEKPIQPPQISSKNTRPAILYPESLSMLALTVLGLMIALEVLLRKSNRDDGLGSIQENTYIHYSWTALPALAFGLLAMVFAAVDFEIRSLAPYMALTRSVSRDAFVKLEFLDMTIPEAMYREIKLRKPWALATTTALLIASLFTIFSASLFQEATFPITASIQLQATKSYSPSNYIEESYEIDAAEISTLILASNYSFPRFTYDTLAFPELVAVTNLSSLDPSTVSISAVVPAVRTGYSCRLYDSTEITTNLTLNDSESGYDNPLTVVVNGEDCSTGHKTKPIMSTYSNATYFSLNSPYAVGCSQILYIWGKLDYNASPRVQHVAALGCNVTFDSVDVNTTFIGSALVIDTEHPPQPIESTVVRNITMKDYEYLSIDIGVISAYAAQVDVYPQLLESFFAFLVTSPWAIPISYLGDASATANVSAAIQTQLGMVMAQMMRFAVAPANASNLTVAAGPLVNAHEDNALPLYAGAATTTTATAGHRRVVQDAASTHVLVALLAAALVLVALGWAAGPRTDVLPRSPTTIASAAALLAGGNVPARLDLVAGGRRWEGPEDMVPALGGPGARFWMGWGVLPDDEGQVAGGENQGGVSQFGLFVVNGDDIAVAKTQWEGAASGQGQPSILKRLTGRKSWQ